VRLDEAHLEAAEDALALNGIDSRRWWGGGLGQHAGMLGFPRTDLPVTRYLAASTLGLPFWPGLPTNDVHVTADLVTAAGRT
jgi:dTDP-4-amino-4,6-dideoxygalactose transaminase